MTRRAIIQTLRLLAVCALTAPAATDSFAGTSAKPRIAGIIQLDAQAATIHGRQARFMVLEGTGNICYWQAPQDWVSWEFSAEKLGQYVLEMNYSCQEGSQGSTFDVSVNGQKLQSKIAEHTGTWYDHETMKLGTVTLDKAGKHTLELKPAHKPGEAVMNLAWVRLIPAEQYVAYLKAAPPQRPRRGDYAGPVYLVPNFHPASCGWLTDFSTERNYCAYSYLDHLDRVRDDPNYCFALSEVNNIMAIMEFEPKRVAELRKRIGQGRVELCNAFFLEPTINLSGGEALVKMGVEGLRWQEQVMGVRPRLVWAIDVTGVHEQMGQITAGLNLDGMVYTRDNPTSKVLHWLESPDGTRALGINPGHYSEWGELFNARASLTQAQVRQLAADVKAKARRTPIGTPVLVLGGGGDYALPPAYKPYPAEFLAQWKQIAPKMDLRFTGLGRYLDAVGQASSLPKVGRAANPTTARLAALDLPVTRSGARLSWTSFWIQCPKAKAGYRHAEHSLQSAEVVATVANLKAGYTYPVQPLYHAWLEMLLNMDRNTLWGAAGGMVFEHLRSWDVRDRFESVEAISARTQQGALRTLLGEGKCMGLFNPLNWRRTGPATITLPTGTRPVGSDCQTEPDGTVLFRPDVPSIGVVTVDLESKPAPAPGVIPLPASIETAHYSAKIDLKTGALTSLKLKPLGREMLAGPVLLVAEKGGDGHNTPPRQQRKRLAESGQVSAEIRTVRGPIATVVTVRSAFRGGGKSVQTIHFYKDSPRIDFDVELHDIPNQTVVVAEFPLAETIQETRRGIPYGFSHGAWGRPNLDLPGYADGIQAAIRWSHYTFEKGGGVAILDRGLPGRELNGNVPVVFLLNAQDTYLGFPCAWLSGRGMQRASFALVAHEGDWKDARIPQIAWEYNSPPLVVNDVAKAASAAFVQTSGNVVVEAIRREGKYIELRMVECLGQPGRVEAKVLLPHDQAVLTDLIGGRPSSVPALTGPDRQKSYCFPVRPQQIVTMRLTAHQPVPEIRPLLKWDGLVPPQKLEALKMRLDGRKGHPPLGSQTAGTP
jgi:alpha-mannosidase